MTEMPQYELIKIIGNGCFGYVFEAIDRTHQKKVALKRIQKVGKHVSREYQILSMIRQCPNVIKVHNMFYSKSEGDKIIQNIVFQYADTSLDKIIDTHAKEGMPIPERTIKDYIYQILNGLQYIHDKGVCHRDLKPQNILLTKNGGVKICDFGSSKVLNPKGKNTPYIVSRYYRAPQLVLSICKYTKAIDIWSVGCILAELYLLRTFLKGETEGDQLFAIMETFGPFTAQQKLSYSRRIPFSTDILEELNKIEGKDLQKEFEMVGDYNNFIDLLKKMLAYVPEKRITAAEALKHPYFMSVNDLSYSK